MDMIEDHRVVRAGDVSVWFGQTSERPISASFHHHANQANWHTVNCLLRFGGYDVDGVSDVAIGIVEWWRTVESLIALLFWLARLESNIGLRPDNDRISPGHIDIAKRWSLVARWFSGGSQSPPSKLTSLMHELRDFRNSFEHSSRTSVVKIKKSKLSSDPSMINEADLMEAMAICIAVCDYWSDTMLGANLMPEVIVPSREYVMFAPLDEMADGSIWPLFIDLLSDRNLGTQVSKYQLDIGKFSGRSSLNAQFLIASRDGFQFESPAKGIDAWGRLEEYAKSLPNLPGAGQFRVPSYAP